MELDGGYTGSGVSGASINNAFISTVDHLPCDVIRSLWLVQWCNIASDRQKMRLDNEMRGIERGELCKTDSSTKLRVVEFKHKVKKLETEALQESRALHNQLSTHKLSLEQELRQLEQLGRGDSVGASSGNDERLKQQLLAHYREHPLKSQLEAVKEQQRRRKLGLQERKDKPKIKLVLRVPKKKETRGRPRKYPLPAPPEPEVEPEPEPEFEPEVAAEPEPRYCFCHQPSFGPMIGCDNEKSCPNGDWFHYKCVGLLNKVDALKYATGKEKWFCLDGCRRAVEERMKKKKRRKW